MSNLIIAFVPVILLIIVSVTTILIVQKFTNRDYQLRLLETKLSTKKEIVMLRLQAYERLILLLERITPAAVIGRLSISGLNAKQLQTLIAATIQTEFEHNYTQQLYVSSDAWNLVVSSKNELIKFITIAASSQAENTTAVAFSQHLLHVLATSEQPLSTQTALDFLKAEARELL